MCQDTDTGHGSRMKPRCREQPSGLDLAPQWLLAGRKTSPHHGHHGPTCGSGLMRACCSLGLSPVTPRGVLLPPTHYSTQQPPGLRARPQQGQLQQHLAT